MKAFFENTKYHKLNKLVNLWTKETNTSWEIDLYMTTAMMQMVSSCPAGGHLGISWSSSVYSDNRGISHNIIGKIYLLNINY